MLRALLQLQTHPFRLYFRPYGLCFAHKLLVDKPACVATQYSCNYFTILYPNDRIVVFQSATSFYRKDLCWDVAASFYKKKHIVVAFGAPVSLYLLLRWLFRGVDLSCVMLLSQKNLKIYIWEIFLSLVLVLPCLLAEPCATANALAVLLFGWWQ